MWLHEGNPNLTDVQKPNAQLSIWKFYPVQGPSFTPLTELQGGRAYIARCGQATSFRLTGKPASVISFLPGNQNIAVPSGYTKTTREFLKEISNKLIICTSVGKWVKNELKKDELKRIYDITPQPAGVPASASGDPNALMTADISYSVTCFSRNDPHIFSYVSKEDYDAFNFSSPQSPAATQTTPGQPTTVSKPVANPSDFFSLWFDKDSISLDRSDSGNIVKNVVTKGQVIGWVKSKVGKMMKLEFAFIGCDIWGGCSNPSFQTVFDGVQDNNPASFNIPITKGMHKEKDSGVNVYIIFRLTDDKGNVLEPIEPVDGKPAIGLQASVSYSISIGGGIGMAKYQFACQEDMKYKSCDKEWIGQPSWYKPKNAGVANLSSRNQTSAPSQTLAPTPAPTAVPAAQKSGDVNKDGKIDLVDLSLLMGKWGQKGSTAGEADINNDSTVNSFDLLIQRSKLVESGIIKSK